jgi:lysophospholipase L1-like esterase
MHIFRIFSLALVLVLNPMLGTVPAAADMMVDSPVTFPERGALPARHPPDRPATSNESAEKEYYIFRTPERSLAQINKIRSDMPKGQFVAPRSGWTNLERTRRILREGGELRLLALGDSIVNDTMRSGWVAKLQEAYPKANVTAAVYVRGGGGCQHFKEDGRIAREVVPRKPDLVFIGGISQRDIESVREVIGQLRAGLPEVEIILATGAFGTVDPRQPAALERAAHSGTGPYGQALKSLAQSEGCAYLDMTTPWAEYIRSANVHPHHFYRDAVHANEHGEQILAKIVLSFLGAGEDITVAEYLARQPAPIFRHGHTLPHLTRFGWTLGFDARVSLAEHWGYALEFGGYARLREVEERLRNPESIESRLCALAASNPERFKLAVIVDRDFPAPVPDEFWVRDEHGNFTDGKNSWQDPGQTKFGRVPSPESPDAYWGRVAESWAAPLRLIGDRAPIAVILNGGEYAMGVAGAQANLWDLDPRVRAARGNRSWFEYASQRKGRQETIVAKAIRESAPDRELYIYYNTSSESHRMAYDGWEQWAYDSVQMRNASDLPSFESYYQHYNSGWTGDRDALTLFLNSAGYHIALGAPLSYNWLCAGWERGGTNDFASIGRYSGFLKCLYTAGMTGGNAGYYAFPKGGFDAPFPAGEPPHWLRQITTLSQVHALFSHLEDFLRQGYLLPGPNRHAWSKDQPAYEIPSGDPGVRVLARKKLRSDTWLLTAWAASGEARIVTVDIPGLGKTGIRATPEGTISIARIENGQKRVEVVEMDAADGL